MKQKLIQAREYLAPIPDRLWKTGSMGVYGLRCCAAGHLGAAAATPELKKIQLTELRTAVRLAFNARFGMSIVQVNDRAQSRFQQSTPKARILAALDECIAAEPG